MNIEQFAQYLVDKDGKTKLEISVLQALQDSEFIKEYDNLKFLINANNQFQNVFNNPIQYDNPVNAQYALYQHVLVEISNAYFSYLYANKGKYSSLKNSITKIEERVEQANENLENIQNLSEFISGEKVLQVYAKEFKGRANNYDVEANKWMKKLYWSFGILGLIVISFLFINMINIDFLKKYLSEEVRHYGYFAIIFIKVIIIVGLIQVTRFFYRNYNANKHLASQSLHKYDVLRALQGVYNTIDSKDSRDELIKAGALTAFQNIESGYITTKEGAGNTDAGLYAAIGSILRK
jgi:amino acid transporter